VINSAENVVFLLIGGEKAEVVGRILVEKSGFLPAERVQPDTGRLLFLLDRDVAAHVHNMSTD
jgi:6-phosphogluconolactonase/glucosamine-6-phosphate isomerase/deaminase